MYKSALDKPNTRVRLPYTIAADFRLPDDLSLEPNHELLECEGCRCKHHNQVFAGGSSLAGGSVLVGGTSDEFSTAAGAALSPCARLSSMSSVFSRRITCLSAARFS